MDSERGGYLRGSHLPWSKPQFGVKVGKLSQFHLESRLTASSPGLQKVVKFSPPVKTLENSGGVEEGRLSPFDVNTRLPGVAQSRA